MHHRHSILCITPPHMLKEIAMTAMTGKGAESSKEHLSALVVNAVKRVALLLATNRICNGWRRNTFYVFGAGS